MQNKNTQIYPHTCQNGCHQKPRNNKYWREYGEKGTLQTVSGNVSWYRHYGKQYGIA